MSKEYKIEDIESDGFLHTSVYEFNYDPEKKIMEINFGFADLKEGGALIDCTIIITDWWNLEVYEYNEQQRTRQFNLNEIPEIDQIIKFSYKNEELILTDYGMGTDKAVDYKFTKPKIHITGEYDPD